MRMRSVVAAATIAVCALPGLTSAQTASIDPARLGVLVSFEFSLKR
jgi:hypothetical protein